VGELVDDVEHPELTVEQLRQALLDFRETYNSTWLIQRYGFRPPTAIRAAQLSPAALAA
jgi:putative transposase